MTNTEDRLNQELDSVLDLFEKANGVSGLLWFRLAAVAVHCLIVIASALWDKERYS